MAEAERLDELFKYFQPAQDILDGNTDKANGYKPGIVQLSLDPVLNAIAQLGCHRLDTDRAFVSLIDSERQYLVAEVTKSVSLYNVDHHPGDKGLAFGVGALDLAAGVCAGSIPGFVDCTGGSDILTQNILADSDHFVIKDFTAEPLYKDRPYVVGFPSFRFYCGVPIRSSSGLVIGSYAVIDNRPREDVSDQDYLVMTEISSSIMRHMELLKTQRSHEDTLNVSDRFKSFLRLNELSPPLTPPDTSRSSSPAASSESSTTSRKSVRSLQRFDLNAASDQYQGVRLRAAALIRSVMRMDEVSFIPAPSYSLSPMIRRPSQHDMLSTSTDRQISTDQVIPETLHHDMLAQHPNGGYFNFASRNLQKFPDLLPQHRDDVKKRAMAMEPGNVSTSQTATQDIQDRLCEAFPLAKALMWLPLFNSEHRDCPWTLLSWTSEKRRVLQEEDFSNLILFGVGIQAQFASVRSAIQGRAKSDFISSLSHELRSPLHGVLGNTELLLQSGIDEEQQMMVSTIEKCGKSLLTTMEHIFTYSKINNESKETRRAADIASNEEIAHTSIDLSVVIEDTVETHMSGSEFRASTALLNEHTSSWQSPQDSLSVNLWIEHNPCWYVYFDARILTRCLTNILGNALKYTSKGFINVEAKLLPPKTRNLSTMSERVVKLVVSDSGRGISAAYLREHLFQPFLQENNTSEGLGLGLSIVKRLVEGVNGSVDVRSTMGQGTIVEILVPVRVDQSHSNDEDMVFSRMPGVVEDSAESATTEARNSRLICLANKDDKTASVISGYCSDWFDIRTIDMASPNEDTVDALVSFEDSTQSTGDGGDDQEITRSAQGCAVVVVSTHLTNRSAGVRNKAKGVFHLRAPFGPRRFGVVMKQAFDYTDNLRSETLQTKQPRTHAISSRPYLTTDATATQEHRDDGDGISGSHTDMRMPSNVLHRTKVDGSPDSGPHVISVLRTKDPNTKDLPINSVAKKEPGFYDYILVVEDNDINLKLVERCLKRWSIACRSASNGAEAVETFQRSERPFDCVLMDISMPVMNGIDATRAIREWEMRYRPQSVPPAKIVALTGLGDKHVQKEAFASGMDAFIKKPFSLKEMKMLLQVKAQ